MSVSRKAAIVLVHGAWHVPAHYHSFVHELENAGFEVACPLLPTCDETKRLTSDTSNDIEVVRTQIKAFLGDSREVIMLLHSYGGVVGTEAVQGLSASARKPQGLSGGIVHIIYMCAFLLQVGESVASASLPRPDPEHVEYDEVSRTTFPCVPPEQLFYADLDAALAQKMASLLVRQSGAAGLFQITYPAWRYIPTTYIRTLEDQILFLHWQDKQINAVRDAGSEIDVETYKSSHSPFLSMTGEMVRVVQRVSHGLA